MYRSFLFLLIVFFACSTDHSLSESERWDQHVSNTEIIRDDFGVPHIYGKTDADAVFGLMYAQAEDDFNRIERNYAWAIGRLAEMEGEGALFSDLRARLYMTREEAEQRYNESPEWLQELCVAFADGLNFYLSTHPEVEPALLTRFEPWMPFYFSEGSIGGDIERISTRKVEEFYTSTVAEASPVEVGLLIPKDNEPRGSNGFAISGSKTKSGNALLLINPHTSFYFRGEVHVVSEEGLNAYGAVTWGQFFVYQGFNEKNGWMHTSTGTDILDEFEETIVRNDQGTFYQFGEELRSLDSIEVTLKFKNETNTLEEKTFKMYRTHHGPITHRNGDKWVSTAIMWEPVNALQQSYLRMKTSNYEEFHEMMDIRTNSSNNTVYADADGTIAYYHGNFIPKRNPAFDYTNPVDGSNPLTAWQGKHDLKDNIHVKNPPNGWIQNCNSTPFTSAAEFSPKKEDYPMYMTSYPENFRGVHAIKLLSVADSLTLESLIELAYDPYLPGAERLIPGLLAAAEQTVIRNQEVKEAIQVLKDWDYTVSVDAIAMTLAQYYLNTYLRSGKIPPTSPNSQNRTWDRFDYMNNESDIKERLEVFEESISALKEDFGSWKTPWGEFNRFQRLNGDIRQDFDDNEPSIPVGMASGSWGALASFGARKGTNTKRQYGSSGNSFVAVVEFGEKVKAMSMLAGGQSGDPDSKHFLDQAQRYADKDFKAVAYYREDVEARAEARYRPGEILKK